MATRQKFTLVLLAVGLSFGFSSVAQAGDDSKAMLAKEDELRVQWCGPIPKQRRLDVEQFEKLLDRVVAGTEEAYLIDCRTIPEFNAGHIPGTDHWPAGQMYLLPKKIKDKTAKIVLWCRTGKRNCYVAGWLIRYGYTNVWLFEDGIVGWIKADKELCNQLMGKFRVVQYDKFFTGKYKEGPKKGQEKDPYRLRRFQPE